MSDKKITGQGGPGRGQGRKRVGMDRGGLVKIQVQVFADQAERMRSEPGGTSFLIRASLDELFRMIDEAETKDQSKQP